MNLQNRIEAFVTLGKFIRQVMDDHSSHEPGSINDEHLRLIREYINTEYVLNNWFVPENIKLALKGLCVFLEEENLITWTREYDIQDKNPKNIGLIMAGNIPLVGFHDLLSILISGHGCTCKLSSKDSRLFTAFMEVLVTIEPRFKSKIRFTTERLTDFDAVIATGSNNTSRYFEYYFGKYPHIIRKNRNSIAVLAGNETLEQLALIGNDVLQYFGMGCRNVSKIWVPAGYDFTTFFQQIEPYNTLLHHNKYMNNHDYNQSVYLLNLVPHLDNGFLILKNDEGLASPLSVVFTSEYKAMSEVRDWIKSNAGHIQCVVSVDHSIAANIVCPGATQTPGLFDYADQVDTMKFLTGL